MGISNAMNRVIDFEDEAAAQRIHLNQRGIVEIVSRLRWSGRRIGGLFASVHDVTHVSGVRDSDLDRRKEAPYVPSFARPRAR